MSYELFYASGGHGGPYPTLLEAEQAAGLLVLGSPTIPSIEVKERSAKPVHQWRVVARVTKLGPWRYKVEEYGDV